MDHSNRSDEVNLLSPTTPVEHSYRQSSKRYIVLTLACCLLVSVYYCYDNPSALESQMTDPNGDFRLTNVNFNLLYSVYSFPNIVLPLIGGLMIDFVGVRAAILLFCVFLIIGQLLVMLGGIYMEYWLLLLGRVFFGFGGETVIVAQSTIVSKWFANQDLAFALAINHAVAMISGTLNAAITPNLYEVNSNYFLPLFVGLILCVGSYVAAVFLCYIDRLADKKEGIYDVKLAESDKVHLSDLKKLNLTYWLLVMEASCISTAFFTLTGNANDLLHTMFGMANSTVGLYLMLIYLIAALITPMIGKFCDKYGHRGSLILFPLCLFMVGLLVLSFYPSDIPSEATFFPLFCVGLFYAGYAAILWPSIPLVVDAKILGTAFGILTSLGNLNLSLSPLIFGAIKGGTEYKEGYFWAIFFIMMQGVIALFCAAAVKVVDFRNGGVLDKVAKLPEQEYIKSLKQSLVR